MEGEGGGQIFQSPQKTIFIFLGSRQRDKTQVFAEESEALDQIAKEVFN